MKSEAPSKSRQRANVRKDLKAYTYLGCPLTKNQSPWCFRLCKPTAGGAGFCGRLAPHGFKSRIQLGIDDFKKRQAGSSTLLRKQEPTRDKDA